MKISLEMGKHTIVLHAHELSDGTRNYEDWETVLRHPFLLRVRLALALSRIKRRHAKMAAFMANNYSIP